jgi:DNA-binding HxlR family transcriptional regulator
MAEFVIQERSYSCPVQLAVSVLAGKWKALILWNLRDQTLRYGELRALLPKVTHKMLAQQLRELEADGVIDRTVYPVVPPKVEYALTDKGRELVPVLREMQRWGMRYKVS